MIWTTTRVAVAQAGGIKKSKQSLVSPEAPSSNQPCNWDCSWRGGRRPSACHLAAALGYHNRHRVRSASCVSRSALPATRVTTDFFSGSPKVLDPLDRYHTVPHTFPDYGSVKGAVRMPRPGDVGRMVGGGHRPINTLANDTGTPKRDMSQRPKMETPSAKRPKLVYTEARLIPPAEEIVDDSDTISRTEPYGSRRGSLGGSRTHIEHFETQYPSHRSNRRTRAPRQTQVPNVVSVKPGEVASMPLRRDDIDDADELGEYSGFSQSRRGTSPQRGSGARTSLDSNGRDGADAQFLPKSTNSSTSSQTPNRGQKRSGPMVISDDELAHQPQPRPNSQSKRVSARNLDRIDPKSVVRKGEITPTKWPRDEPAASLVPSSEGVRVRSAVCYQNYQYVAPEAEPVGSVGKYDLCFLLPTPEIELRAYKADGQQAEQYKWLRITDKTQFLYWNPDSNIIKISQSTDMAAGVGGLLIMRFFALEDAARVVKWTAQNTKVKVCTQESGKLESAYDKALRDTSRAVPPQADPPANGVIERLPRGLAISQRANGSEVSSGTRPVGSLTSRSRRFRDQMQVSARPVESNSVEMYEEKQPARRTLRSRQIIEEPITVEDVEPSLPRWSEENKEWTKNWKIPLVFQRTTVEMDDIPRLDEGECLNDNIIGFGLRYLFEVFASRAVNLDKRVYVHNTFFHEKLKSDKSYKGKINYEGVKSWTSKVDLLGYDYIVVPVNEHYHWWLAIICNPGKLAQRPQKPSTKEGAATPTATGVEPSSDVEMVNGVDSKPQTSPREAAAAEISQLSIDSPRDPSNASQNPEHNSGGGTIVDLVEDPVAAKETLSSPKRTKKRGRKSVGPPPRTYDPSETRIITLDSLGVSHSASVTALKYYLQAEFEHKRNIVIDDLPLQLGMKAVGIPEQKNFHDCGVYLLGYMQEFIRDPDQFVNCLLRKESVHWNFQPAEMRKLWRDVIFLEHAKYQGRHLPKEKSAPGVPAEAVDKQHQLRVAKGSKEDSHGILETRGQNKPMSSAKTSPRSLEGAHSSPKAKIIGDTAPRPYAPPVRASSAVVENVPEPESPKRAVLPGSWPAQDGVSSDEVALLQPSEDPTLPSIEDKTCSPGKSEDPIEFVAKLPSLTPPAEQPAVEQDEDRIYCGNSFSVRRSSNEKRRQQPTPSLGVTQSSPRRMVATVSAGRRIGGAEPPLRSPYFSSIPAVEMAELDRAPNAIDLTGDEDGVI